MSETARPSLPCECGLSIEAPETEKSHEHREVACRCGRLHDLEFLGGRWRTVGVLTPEGSVPVSGFSTSLRQRGDVRRFWFRHELSPTGMLIGHVVFSPSSGEAEVKAADLKVVSFRDVASATEARRRWVENGVPRASQTRRIRRLGRPSPPQTGAGA